MSDKRKYRRFLLEKSIFLKFESDPLKTIEGKLLEISFLGISVFLKDDVNVDTMAQAIVQFDSYDHLGVNLAGKGRVVSVKPHKLYAQNGFRIGVEFVEVDKEVVIQNLERLEAKILEQIRKNSQLPRKDSGPF